MDGTFTLYSQQNSGNCYKPRLLMHQLGLPFQIVDIDSQAGETRTDGFLQRNPNGKVPLLELPDGRYLSESNAMLLHLAEGSAFIPEDSYDRAVCYQWLFFEQYSHEPYIAVARAVLHLTPGGRDGLTEARARELKTGGDKALSLMDKRLTGRDWLAGPDYSIADIALYAYTHVAEQGDFDLSGFPAIRAWLGRVAATPGFIDIDWRP